MRVSLSKSLAKLGPWLDDVQETWIGWSLPPANRAIKDAGWKPDNASIYCRRCGASVGIGEATVSGCGSCRNNKINTDAVVRLGPYADKLRDWVLLTKYQRWPEMGEALGSLLGIALRKSVCIDYSLCIVVPMPMPWQRRIYRGIDHALVTAGAVASELKLPLFRVLAKNNGIPQVAKSSSERIRTGGKGFKLARRLGGWNLSGIQVLLIDDVMTTGASIRGASNVLRKAGSTNVIGGVIAVSDELARRERSKTLLESSIPLIQAKI